MSLRARLAAFIALAVGITAAIVALSAYRFARDEAVAEVDEFLRSRGPVVGLVGVTEFEEFRSRAPRVPGRSGPGGQPEGVLDQIVREDAVAQLIDADGETVTIGLSAVELPVDSRDLEIAGGGGPDYLRDTSIGGVHYRILTRPVLPGLAIQVGRDVTSTDQILAGLRLRLSLLGLSGVAVAAAAAWYISGRSLRPVAALTEAAERVATTHRLEERIDIDRSDELGRLAESFNSMLAALEESRRDQQRLVADASHELRTPLTSLRTNIELLARGSVAESEREELLADLTSEVGELSHIVAELVDLATVGGAEETAEPVDLEVVVEEAISRARRRTDLEFVARLEPTRVTARPRSLARAVSNLLDNAAKWGADGSRIEVELSGGRLSVRDHGPGIPPADLRRIFERFYRSPEARSRPGSGLGLSIVAAVVDDLGGEVFAANAPGGGAAVGFTLPVDST